MHAVWISGSSPIALALSVVLMLQNSTTSHRQAGVIADHRLSPIEWQEKSWSDDKTSGNVQIVDLAAFRFHVQVKRLVHAGIEVCQSCEQWIKAADDNVPSSFCHTVLKKKIV